MLVKFANDKLFECSCSTNFPTVKHFSQPVTVASILIKVKYTNGLEIISRRQNICVMRRQTNTLNGKKKMNKHNSNHKKNKQDIHILAYWSVANSSQMVRSFFTRFLENKLLSNKKTSKL